MSPQYYQPSLEVMFNSTFLNEFTHRHTLPENFGETARRWFFPLTEEIRHKLDAGRRPFFVGINGCQGSGKSTLADFIAGYLTRHAQLKVAVLSLDDFYYSSEQRSRLSSEVHPLLQTRGVPGTHNAHLMAEVLEGLSAGATGIALPRFDKASDNPAPTENWPVINEKVDLVLLEGWCWGVTPQLDVELLTPVNQLEEEADPDGRWRHYVNGQLREHYQGLYQIMDYWIMLKAPSFEHVYQWRLEQEQKLAQRLGSDGCPGLMTPTQVEAFVQYFQRLTEHGLRQLPSRCDKVFQLNAERTIVRRH